MVSDLGKRVNAHSWHLGTDQDLHDRIWGKGALWTPTVEDTFGGGLAAVDPATDPAFCGTHFS